MTTLEQKKHTLTLPQVIEQTGKSRRTIFRYIENGTLSPIKEKNQYDKIILTFDPVEVSRVSRVSVEVSKSGTNDTLQNDTMAHDIEVNPNIEVQSKGVSTSVNDTHNDTPQVARIGLQKQTKPDVEQGIGDGTRGTHNDTNDTLQNTDVVIVLKERLQDKEEVVDVLKQQIEAQNKQLEVKDKQITGLLERQKETNVLLSQAQDKIVKLEAPKQEQPDIIYQQESTTTESQPPKEQPNPGPKKPESRVERKPKKNKKKKQKQEQPQNRGINEKQTQQVKQEQPQPKKNKRWWQVFK